MSLENVEKKFLKHDLISKSRKIRRRARNRNVLLHIGSSKVQGLEALSCSYMFGGLYFYYTRLVDMEAEFLWEEETKATIFSCKKI